MNHTDIAFGTSCLIAGDLAQSLLLAGSAVVEGDATERRSGKYFEAGTPFRKHGLSVPER